MMKKHFLFMLFLMGALLTACDFAINNNRVPEQTLTKAPTETVIPVTATSEPSQTSNLNPTLTNDDSLLGIWDLELNWNCDSTHYTGELIFFPDKVIANAETEGTAYSHEAKWTFSGNEVQFTFDSTAQYRGIVSGNKIIGTMIGDENCSGSWSAVK
jgi:hypothetical protein